MEYGATAWLIKNKKINQQLPEYKMKYYFRYIHETFQMKRFQFLILFCCVSGFIIAQKKTEDLTSKINLAADKIESKCIAWRRDIHQNPELGNNEYRTAKIIADHLRSLGIEVKEKVGKTGVVGILKGAKPGPCIGLRADMDGLPVVERVDLPFASKQKSIYNGQEVGVMHACGHDTHVAILMSVAEILSGMKNELKGTIKFIFQPAEEGPPQGEEGGAPLMIKEGVLDDPKVDAMFGLHISAETEVGKITYRSGGFYAASDWFTITIKGKQTHGAQPWAGVDPVVVAAQIINGLQTIVSRQIDITKNPAVISVSTVHGGVRANIIPEELIMQGTIRTLDTAMQRDIHEKMKLKVSKLAEANGATAEIEIQPKTVVTYNNRGLVKQMLPSFIKTAGAENVAEIPPVTGGEDFSYFSEKVPSIFFNIGGKQKGVDPSKVHPHHTPDFWIDESGMKTGIKVFCNLVFDYMNAPATNQSSQNKKPF
jgi:amidohydrolase